MGCGGASGRVLVRFEGSGAFAFLSPYRARVMAKWQAAHTLVEISNNTVSVAVIFYQMHGTQQLLPHW